MDRMDLYRVFARVVECASFTRAAESLGLPRSSVSAAVQMLETRLGARLLNRTTRRVSVTEDGAIFYERCVRLLSDMEEAEDLFRNAGGRPSGRQGQRGRRSEPRSARRPPSPPAPSRSRP